MFVYIIAGLAVALAAAGLMLWPTHLLPLWRMYRAGDFAWAESVGITAPRLAVIGTGAAGLLGFIAAVWVLLFVSYNPFAIVGIMAVIAGGPALGLALLARRSLTQSVAVWFDDGSAFGGRIDSREPRRDWFTADPQLFMPVGRGESIWLYAPQNTGPADLVNPVKWQSWGAPDFLATAGQNSSLFYARCDTSALRRNSQRRNKGSIKNETIRASIILAMTALFGLLGFLGMTAAPPA